jgi:hypothetical protein
MTPAQVSAQLHAAIDDAMQLFAGVDETRTARRPEPGKWCAREVLGHLIDSACNNHRRFVLGQGSDLKKIDGYRQDDWVGRQHYDRVPWRDLVALWSSYNRHLAHVIGCAPAATLGHSLESPAGPPVTLGFLMEDYVTHLRHHLDQLRTLLAA